MKTLIVPMAGQSSRFPNTRPKWMLTHPATNRFMVTESISGINLDFFDKIYFVFLQDHEDKYMFMDGFVKELDDIGLKDKSHIALLPEKTSSQSETVYKLIQDQKINGFIFIKDSDGYFQCNLKDETNQVAYFDLNDLDNINARTKSYIQLDVNNVITNIVEKRVISSNFCAGGYGFDDAEEFCETYEKIKDNPGECYVSHIIFEMMLFGSVFYGTKTSNFLDWGTLTEWNKFKREHKCLFVDIDGTLVTNSSIHFPPYVGMGEPLQENIDFLNDLRDSGKVVIILTTSRPDSMRTATIREMKRIGMRYDNLIMGLPHCQRIVINDFANSNPYPSCGAINLPRNSNKLKDFYQ
jgi:hypothetical protein